MRLKCPMCSSLFVPPQGVDPVCPNCGYAPGVSGPRNPLAPLPISPIPSAQPAPWAAGAAGYPNPGAAPQGANPLAIASLVLGIVGFIPGLSVLALIFGIVARRQIRQRNQRSAGVASAGIVLGAVFTGLWLLYLFIGLAFELSQ